MAEKIKRIYVEKKKGFDLESESLTRELIDYLGIDSLQQVRILNCYDTAGLSDHEFALVRKGIFYEPPLDLAYDELPECDQNDRIFAVEYLPGQYDMRADFAAQCAQIITAGERPVVHWRKVFIVKGDITEDEFVKIKEYCINSVECREASLELPESLAMEFECPGKIETLEGFRLSDNSNLVCWHENLNLAMDIQDLIYCRDYFRDIEKRDPTITEIKVLDTYWSDHCRHSTFNTVIDSVTIEEGKLNNPVRQAYHDYLEDREYLNVSKDRPAEVCLMDLATICMKSMRKKGLLEDLEESEEVNAASIITELSVDGKKEEWLIMFKNETHNHPTEIEPYGGAATCLGGCIRDPLSGRSYAYQAMRITGSGDPRTSLKDTLPGKLPQRKITTEAARGFSSYGNQIGLATGQVEELYHEKYVAKRMEIGFVIGAAPRENVHRESPAEGDIILLVGGRTGRDGCGGATGSSRPHTEEAIEKHGTEVQKGNAPEERKLQRLFRNPSAAKLIKKANDFGAGGVSVAVGELASGLEIELDVIPQKYAGLDGTELAISESQERMAVVVSPENEQKFTALAEAENLECTSIARVNAGKRLKMRWQNETIVDLARDFLDSGGVRKHTVVKIDNPCEKDNYFKNASAAITDKLPDLKAAWLANLQDLNVCSQRGLIELFDSTVGAGSILMPLGGKYQDTETEGMVARLPLLRNESELSTLVTYGFDPALAEWNPYLGALYAVIEAVTKNVAMGGDYRRIRLTLQEYFAGPGENPSRWGKPFAALLGAYTAQEKLGIPAVSGKDSMSGSFNDLDIPPTVVSFAVNVVTHREIVSAEFKECGSKVIMLETPVMCDGMPDFDILQKNLTLANKLIRSGEVLAAHTVTNGGAAAAISKMCFGNRIGFKFTAFHKSVEELFAPHYGSMILELKRAANLKQLGNEVSYHLLGETIDNKAIHINDVSITLEEAVDYWKKPLEAVFPVIAKTAVEGHPLLQSYSINPERLTKPTIKVARPTVFIPVFPGTNCEYETESAFEKAGAAVDMLVFKNLTPAMISESITEMVRRINEAQMVVIPGGFSAGDEPDGTAKFITAVFSNPYLREAVNLLLRKRDGLMLGICNGFQALIKTGLIPYGEFRSQGSNSPTLSFNRLERHISRIVNTRINSVLTPWLAYLKPGDVHSVIISHGEGRFTADDNELKTLFQKGQVASQYIDFNGNPTYDSDYNPNGSLGAVEGLTSPCGRVFGKMGHPERGVNGLTVNIPGIKEQRIFEAGVAYYR